MDVALETRNQWLIEPAGYGETRLNGIKAYCKMDFLFPIDGKIYIADWKTGKQDLEKHRNQLLGYAAATHHNFSIPWDKIHPKIVYFYPHFAELEVPVTREELLTFFTKVKNETEEMLSFCKDTEKNIPKPIESFECTPYQGLCKNCNFQEICPSQAR